MIPTRTSGWTALLLLLLLSWSCNQSVDDSFSSKEYDAVSIGFSNSAEGAGGSASIPVPPGQLTAGEWNDLDNWSFWQDLLRRQEFSDVLQDWQLPPYDRISVQVLDSDAEPLVDAEVRLMMGDQILWQARSDNEGHAELFLLHIPGMPILSETHIHVRQQHLEVTVESPIPFTEGANTISIMDDIHWYHPADVDLAFVVDATGSMGDEIRYIQAELANVLSRVQAINPSLNYHYGSVFYRDEGDEYVTRRADFSTELLPVLNFIGEQEANGGGNYPEAVDEALHEAINQLQWSESARARLLFLVLDAPPHEDEQVLERLRVLIPLAAAKGIQIVPVTASGINVSTEYLVRAMAILTNSTYTFITDHSGIGSSHLEPNVGEYEVEFLNDMLVRLISESVRME